jgi:hypothetical protein
MASGRPLTILALVLASYAVVLPARVVAAGREPRRITVRVYQTGDVPASVEERALSEAARLLRGARVDVRWRQCVGQPCNGPSSTAELFLRIMRTGSPRQSRVAALGEALVPHRTSAGVLATVFLDRVEWLAFEAGIDLAQLLGRVAAHELGHLLMRTRLHAPGGLMRATWTADEVRRDRALDWAFRPGDASAMRVAGP